MRDFTVSVYENLLNSLHQQGYSFFTFHDYATGSVSGSKWVVLRHDVDARPENSLRMARLQAEKGVRGTYYFRMVKQSFNEQIIREISSLGHEIGFHYETMDSQKGNIEKAYREFCQQLEILRDVVPVTTISMHGSPLSPFDNRELWRQYDYRSLGLIGEPYFDLDFNRVFYITDTGRRWDGDRLNFRDKATKNNPVTNPEFLKLSFRSTQQLIKAINEDVFPAQAMMNFHPQRWNNDAFHWMKELLLQNLKNGIKWLIAGIK